MIEPDNFGLDAVRTMAHVGDPVRSSDHSGFWKRWYTSLLETAPALSRRVVDDESDPSATHEFESIGGVRIGCALTLPSNGTPIHRALITTHGYSDPSPLARSAKKWQKISDQGVAVLEIRLRGYPGSQIGIGEQISADANDAGWIARGFDSERDDEWILPHAVADLCNAVRVMRNILLRRGEIELDIADDLDRPGVWLHGESLGGGIATIAASQVIGRLPNDPVVDRLAIALPSLGAWTWRLHQRTSGTAQDIERVIVRQQDRAAELIDRLRLCDSVIHALHVRVPTLAMLACRDDVVPAPSAAAIYNAIDADPGRKWRFTVPYGHFEGGMSNARRHALFQRVMNDFFDPMRAPMQAMEAWEPMMHASSEQDEESK